MRDRTLVECIGGMVSIFGFLALAFAMQHEATWPWIVGSIVCMVIGVIICWLGVRARKKNVCCLEKRQRGPGSAIP